MCDAYKTYTTRLQIHLNCFSSDLVPFFAKAIKCVCVLCPLLTLSALFAASSQSWLVFDLELLILDIHVALPCRVLGLVCVCSHLASSVIRSAARICGGFVMRAGHLTWLLLVVALGKVVSDDHIIGFLVCQNLLLRLHVHMPVCCIVAGRGNITSCGHRSLLVLVGLVSVKTVAIILNRQQVLLALNPSDWLLWYGVWDGSLFLLLLLSFLSRRVGIILASFDIHVSVDRVLILRAK